MPDEPIIATILHDLFNFIFFKYRKNTTAFGPLNHAKKHTSEKKLAII